MKKFTLVLAIALAIMGLGNMSWAGIGQYDSFPWNWNLPFAGEAIVTQSYNGACGGIYASHFGNIVNAVDLSGGGASYGKPIKAPASGYVKFAGWSGWYTSDFGNQVIVEAGDTGQGNGNRYLYRVAHMKSTPLVVAGWWVEKGDVLGYVGSTGESTGAHIHFDVYRGSYGGYGRLIGESFPPSFAGGVDDYDGCCDCWVDSDF